jgi:hypothetical protein
MKLLKWPINRENDSPIDQMKFDDDVYDFQAEAYLVDAGGLYRLLPKSVMANAIAELAQTKKAEGTKALLPLVCLRFEQTIPISPEVAQVLLEEVTE